MKYYLTASFSPSGWGLKQNCPRKMCSHFGIIGEAVSRKAVVFRSNLSVCVNIKAFNKCTGRLSVVNLEPIKQSEVSQKETEISYINTCMESSKMVLMNYLQGSDGDSDVANRLVDTGQEGEGGTN